MRATTNALYLSLYLSAVCFSGCTGDDTPGQRQGEHAGGDGHGTAMGACAAITDKDTYSANMVKPGTAGLQVRLIDSTPAPPTKGDNAWQFEVLDETGAVLSDVNIAVEPFMPHHGHGTPIKAVVTAPEAGNTAFHAAPVNLWMPGLWEVRIHVSDGDTALDTVTYKFCIDG